MKRPLVGILLVFVNLMCDGFTNAKQDELNRKYVALLRAAIRLHALVLSTMLASVNPGHCAFVRTSCMTCSRGRVRFAGTD